jgi:predicted ribosome quality control (RQC) complex YloA/Tae2 family protein
MQQMSNLDLFFLIPELKTLEQTFLNNIYQKNNVFKFKFRNQNLVVDVKNAVYISNYEFEAEEPRGFVKDLRDELSNQRLLSIEQVNFDRISKLNFTHSTLIIELATGNIALLEEGKVKSYLKESARIYKNRDYTPLKTKKHPLELKESDFETVKGEVVPAVSKLINLSAFYIEEACVRAGAKGKIEGIDKKKLIESLKSLFAVKEPRVYYENGIPKFFSSIPLEKLELDFKAFPTLNQALDEYYSNQVKINEKMSKLEFKLAQQKKALEDFQAKATENREKGEAIYGNYSLIESILKNPEEALKKIGVKAKTKGREVIIEL